MKLFLVYLGGTAPGANIELHDIRFVVGERIEDTYQQLKQQWFGSVRGLHLDSYLHVHHVDGYKVDLVREPQPAHGDKLYFVNFGGYFPGRIPEFHDFTLCVANSPEQAKQKGYSHVLREGLANSEQPHKDDLLAVDDCLAVDLLDGWYVKLTADSQRQLLKPDWSGYEVIG